MVLSFFLVLLLQDSANTDPNGDLIAAPSIWVYVSPPNVKWPPLVQGNTIFLTHFWWFLCQRLHFHIWI